MFEIGDRIYGNSVYGSKSSLVGEITNIEHNDEDGNYIMDDIISIAWNDGTSAKFYRKHI